MNAPRRVTAAPLLRVRAKFTVKKGRMLSSKSLAYGVFDCEFDFDSHVRSCSWVLDAEAADADKKEPRKHETHPNESSQITAKSPNARQGNVLSDERRRWRIEVGSEGVFKEK